MTDDPFLRRREHYHALASEHARAYGGANPFPHVVIDNFLPEELASDFASQFPAPDDPSWKTFNDPTGLKLASGDVSALGVGARSALAMFNQAPFLEFLEQLTGITGLIPDPWFEGAGLHQIPRGGFLKIHADFNVLKRLKLDRRINVLLYLNEDWEEEYGGHLELWDREMTSCQRKVLPTFNRCVVFNTTDDAFHGHPEPLTCPAGRTRKSIALYYYTNGRPEDERHDAHSTLYQVRPEEAAERKSVGYRLRSGSSRALDVAASIAHQPSKWLRALADRLRPGW